MVFIPEHGLLKQLSVDCCKLRIDYLEWAWHYNIEVLHVFNECHVHTSCDICILTLKNEIHKILIWSIQYTHTCV